MASVNSANPADAGGGGGQATNTVSIGASQASAAGATVLSSPHIVQYPRPPKRDDGRWIALSSVIGNIIGKLSSQKVVKEAKSAENKWRDVMAKMKDIADREAARTDPLRDKAQGAMEDLDKRNVLNWQRADTENAYADQTKPCVDNNADELCKLADCGYQPDYDGILMRVKADAEQARVQEMDKICRMNNRYNTGWTCETKAQVAIATQAAIIGATNKLREEERLNKWKYDVDVKHKMLTTMEQIRTNRMNAAQSFDKQATNVRMTQYQNYTSDAWKSLEMGANLLASHGQNAAWLADSLRKTAKESMADWGVLATMITGLVLAWNSKGSAAKADDCGG